MTAFPDLAGQARADAEALAALLANTGRLGVAFSGGVDSAVLLAVALRTLGRHNVVALLAVSPHLPASERDTARALAADLGATLVEFETDELSLPDYQNNTVDRCYHCKSAMFAHVSSRLVRAHRLDAVAYGENADDTLAPDRPGAKAALEHRVRRPLADAGLTKVRVRDLARALGLPVADKPAAPCLATRIPHGQPVTAAKLAQIEAAEDALRALGFTGFRVRHHGEIARIEAPGDQWGRFADENVRGRALNALKAAGFNHVTLDLAGLQSGAFSREALNHV